MSIYSDAENKLAKSLAEQSNGCVWIGLRFHKDVDQVIKQLQWTGGAYVNFTKWNVIDPASIIVANSGGGSASPTRKRRDIPPHPSAGNNYVCVSYDEHSTFWQNESCSKDCYFVCKKKGRSK